MVFLLFAVVYGLIFLEIYIEAMFDICILLFQILLFPCYLLLSIVLLKIVFCDHEIIINFLYFEFTCCYLLQDFIGLDIQLPLFPLNDIFIHLQFFDFIIELVGIDKRFPNTFVFEFQIFDFISKLQYFLFGFFDFHLNAVLSIGRDI